MKDDHRGGSIEKVIDWAMKRELQRRDKGNSLREQTYIYGVCVGWICNAVARKCFNYSYNSGWRGEGTKLAC